MRYILVASIVVMTRVYKNAIFIFEHLSDKNIALTPTAKSMI
jgi:hypothetical protein